MNSVRMTSSPIEPTLGSANFFSKKEKQISELETKVTQIANSKINGLGELNKKIVDLADSLRELASIKYELQKAEKTGITGIFTSVMWGTSKRKVLTENVVRVNQHANKVFGKLKQMRQQVEAKRAQAQPAKAAAPGAAARAPAQPTRAVPGKAASPPASPTRAAPGAAVRAQAQPTRGVAPGRAAGAPTQPAKAAVPRRTAAGPLAQSARAAPVNSGVPAARAQVAQAGISQRNNAVNQANAAQVQPPRAAGRGPAVAPVPQNAQANPSGVQPFTGMYKAAPSGSGQPPVSRTSSGDQYGVLPGPAKPDAIQRSNYVVMPMNKEPISGRNQFVQSAKHAGQVAGPRIAQANALTSRALPLPGVSARMQSYDIHVFTPAHGQTSLSQSAQLEAEWRQHPQRQAF